jgi:hypothetical protein
MLGFAHAFNAFYLFLHLLFCVLLVFAPAFFLYMLHCPYFVGEGLEIASGLEGRGVENCKSASKCVQFYTQLTLESQLSN